MAIFSAQNGVFQFWASTEIPRDQSVYPALKQCLQTDDPSPSTPWVWLPDIHVCTWDARTIHFHPRWQNIIWTKCGQVECGQQTHVWSPSQPPRSASELWTVNLDNEAPEWWIVYILFRGHYIMAKWNDISPTWNKGISLPNSYILRDAWSPLLLEDASIVGISGLQLRRFAGVETSSFCWYCWWFRNPAPVVR